LITALDTSVLLDVFAPDPVFLDRSRAAIQSAFANGALVICEPVYAELASRFATQGELDRVLNESAIRVEEVGKEAAFVAGRIFRSYKNSGGSRERIITDFLIGAHALQISANLLTRDRGFYRDYFKGLNVVDPSA